MIQAQFTIELLKVRAAIAAYRARTQWAPRGTVPYDAVAQHPAVERLCELCFHIDEENHHD